MSVISTIDTQYFIRQDILKISGIYTLPSAVIVDVPLNRYGRHGRLVVRSACKYSLVHTKHCVEIVKQVTYTTLGNGQPRSIVYTLPVRRIFL